jgi:hypothetical protein
MLLPILPRLPAACRVLAVVPVSVVYVSSKLSLLPVLLFGSLDPEHAVHAVRSPRPCF